MDSVGTPETLEFYLYLYQLHNAVNITCWRHSPALCLCFSMGEE